ncbi:MAG: hypothetical protein IPM46_07880 [Flavobacteriales bacterium]|nr:hypothetical protein [Flavobacteriales bacterium]
MPRLIVHGFTISLTPCTFRMAVATMAVMVGCTVTHAQVDSAYIVAVDGQVQKINEVKDYELRTLENEEFLEQMTDGGGDLTGMFKNGELIKVVKRVGLSSCVDITEYYFRNSQLVFVSAQGLEFAYIDSTASFDPDVQQVTMEGRFYYSDSAAAPVLLKGSTRCGGAPTKEWAAMFAAEVARLKDLLMR